MSSIKVCIFLHTGRWIEYKTRQSTYNVTLRCVHAGVVAVEEQLLVK